MTSRIAKHLDGWQVGLLAVLIAWTVAILVVPRHVEPTEVPLPRVTPRELERLRTEWAATGASLRDADASDTVRLLASRVRAYGRAEAEGHPKQIETARDAVVVASSRALRDDPEQVVALEARYAKGFVDSYLRWLQRGVTDVDLVELGGDATRTLSESGWSVTADAIPEDYDVVLRALHRKRFVALVGPHPSLAPPPDEAIVFIRFSMEREKQTARGYAALLDDIAQLEGLAPSYPAGYARGVVLFKAGRYEASAASFDSFLSDPNNRAYRTRAANYLRAAVEEAQPE